MSNQLADSDLSSDYSQQEFGAIRDLVFTLGPLSADSRERVLLFALHRLGIMQLRSPEFVPTLTSTTANGGLAEPRLSGSNSRPVFRKTIAELRKEKSPKYATQMAAIVGYYLLVVVPEDQHKTTITVDDLRTYFSKADFDLPARPGDILPHAEDSGYFEHLGDGEYKLTELGYKLVDEKLPSKRKASGSF